MLDSPATWVRSLSRRVAVVEVVQVFFRVIGPLLLSPNPKPDRFISVITPWHPHQFML